MKKIILLFVCLIMCGCAYTGSLDDKEKDAIMNKLIEDNYIDYGCLLEAKPIGEGELFRYSCETNKGDKKYTVKTYQIKHNEEERVFEILIMNEEDEIEETLYAFLRKDNIKFDNNLN